MGTNPLTSVLSSIYLEPKKLQSNFCRENSQMVARLASQGFITTRYPEPTPTLFGWSWRITGAGLHYLENA